jgi:preprotein translocase subunit SecY
MRQYKKNILLNRFLISLVILIFIRLGTFLPIPEIDHKQLIFFCKKNSILEDFIQLTTGNNLFILGLFRLNIFPYINASILSQILLNYFPSILNIQKDNNHRFEEILQKLTRIVTLFIALFQSINITYFLKSFLPDFNIYLKSEIILVLTTGAMIVLWLSEIITEYGLGNGASLLIYTNIISSLPNLGKKLISENTNNLTTLSTISIGLLFFIAIAGIITLQESARIVPLISSKQLGQSQSFVSSAKSNNYIPLRFNQAGVMPIILTTAILVLPNYIINLGVFPLLTLPIFLKSSKIIYWISYFALILIFSSFYSTIVLNPKDISQELQKMAVSIPGVRPGLATTFYLKQVMKRVTFFGAIILAILATLPNIIEGILNVSSFNGLGTTSLLILVGVVLDISREMKSIILSNIYNEKFD